MEPTLDYDTWTGRAVYDCDGDKIGDITDIYYDDVSGRPEWVEVKAGLFKGGRLAPLAGARVERIADEDDDHLVVNFPSHRVKDAPSMDTDDDRLAPDQERELYDHYGFDWNGRTKNDFGYGKQYNQDRFDKDYPKRQVGAIGNVGTEDRGTVAAEATIRNQEAQVVEGTETVRLRKYQHTEMVPVTKEEVRVERVQDEGQRNA